MGMVMEVFERQMDGAHTDAEAYLKTRRELMMKGEFHLEDDHETVLELCKLMVEGYVQMFDEEILDMAEFSLEVVGAHGLKEKIEHFRTRRSEFIRD